MTSKAEKKQEIRDSLERAHALVLRALYVDKHFDRLNAQLQEEIDRLLEEQAKLAREKQQVPGVLRYARARVTELERTLHRMQIKLNSKRGRRRETTEEKKKRLIQELAQCDLIIEKNNPQ